MSYEIDLGPWGVDLDDAAFGRALAALGVGLGAAPPRSSLDAALDRGSDADGLRAVLAAGAPTRWEIARITALKPAALAGMAARHPAAPFAAAWAAAVGTPDTVDLPRLAIERFTDEIGPYYWLADQLAQPGVNASASVVAGELKSDHGWHWPLRIGFFDDAAGAAFRARIKPQDWSSPLARLVSIDVAGSADLLILPQALPDALARLAALRDPLDVGCILSLGGLAGRSDMAVAGIVGTLRLGSRGWGMAIADVSADSADAWMSDLIANLAHNATFDSALRASLVDRGRGVLFAEPAALASSVVMHAAARMATAMAAPLPEPMRKPIDLDDPSFARAEPPEPVALPGLESFGLPPQTSTETLIAEATDPANFGHEGQGATATAALAHRLRERRKAAPRRVERRFIQVEIREGPRFVGRPRRTALVAGTPHAIDVWVGPVKVPIHEAAPIHGADPVNLKGLPDDRPIELRVAFAELDGERRTRTATIVLPPTGAARPHRFFFQPTAPGMFRARIILSYKNRILQTAVLTAPVNAPSRAAASAATRGATSRRIVLRTEAVVRPGLAELRHRRPFGVALVHNHDDAGTPGGTALAGGRAVPLQLGDIGPTVDTIRSLLSDAAQDPASYGPTLDADATVALLFKLAHQGVLLRDDLLGRPAIADLVAGAERIQILSASANDILPLEFAYDFPTPARPPKLCPNARQALLDGHCDGRDHHEDAEGHIDVVCPAGFWAITRVIERHVADPDALARDGGGAPHELASEPMRDRDRLTGLTGAVFAASARVDSLVPGSSTLVETTLAEMTGGRSTRVRTWGDWVKTVGEARPSLLVLLAHNVRDDLTATSSLEIETDERRDASDITSRFIAPDSEPGTPPLVFLLGCDTAKADMQYQTFVSRFRQVGAAIVVGTISTVAGSHAAGVAASLSRAVKRPDEVKWQTFGDLLRDVRRSLLADGEVMALSLTAYGDADWQFPGGRTDVDSTEADR